MATSDAYLAGLFDGEGCVSMHLAKAGYVSVQAKRKGTRTVGLLVEAA
jgi:hypothetical protein